MSVEDEASRGAGCGGWRRDDSAAVQQCSSRRLGACRDRRAGRICGWVGGGRKAARGKGEGHLFPFVPCLRTIGEGGAGARASGREGGLQSGFKPRGPPGWAERGVCCKRRALCVSLPTAAKTMAESSGRRKGDDGGGGRPTPRPPPSLSLGYTNRHAPRRCPLRLVRGRQLNSLIKWWPLSTIARGHPPHGDASAAPAASPRGVRDQRHTMHEWSPLPTVAMATVPGDFPEGDPPPDPACARG